MNRKIIRGFDAAAQSYDTQRRCLIPCFEDFYYHAVWALPDRPSPETVCDLGAGTGLLSAYIKAKFPETAVTLVDLSAPMLEKARNRFAGTPGVSFVEADYLHDELEGPFDAVVSALSIHHFDDEGKRGVFRRAFDLLAPGGVFINADQALGETEAMEKRFYQSWIDFIESSSLTRAEIDAAYKRMSNDKTSRISDQITWLNRAGFTGAECIYRYQTFAVLTARKDG